VPHRRSRPALIMISVFGGQQRADVVDLELEVERIAS
jgi:hypothetical protein